MNPKISLNIIIVQYVVRIKFLKRTIVNNTYISTTHWIFVKTKESSDSITDHLGNIRPYLIQIVYYTM